MKQKKKSLHRIGYRCSLHKKKSEPMLAKGIVGQHNVLFLVNSHCLIEALATFTKKETTSSALTCGPVVFPTFTNNSVMGCKRDLPKQSGMLIIAKTSKLVIASSTVLTNTFSLNSTIEQRVLQSMHHFRSIGDVKNAHGRFTAV